jgi:hypothetical protein
MHVCVSCHASNQHHTGEWVSERVYIPELSLAQEVAPFRRGIGTLQLGPFCGAGGLVLDLILQIHTVLALTLGVSE